MAVACRSLIEIGAKFVKHPQGLRMAIVAYASAPFVKRKVSPRTALEAHRELFDGGAEDGLTRGAEVEIRGVQQGGGRAS